MESTKVFASVRKPYPEQVISLIREDCHIALKRFITGYHQLIILTLYYASGVNFFLKLQHIRNLCARLILHYSPTTPYKPVFEKTSLAACKQKSFKIFFDRLSSSPSFENSCVSVGAFWTVLVLNNFFVKSVFKFMHVRRNCPLQNQMSGTNYLLSGNLIVNLASE